MFVLYRGSSFILMDASGSVIYINMSIKPEICDIAVNAKAQKWEGNNLYEYMVIYIQTQTVSMSLSSHYPMLCTTRCSPNESTGIISLQ